MKTHIWVGDGVLSLDCVGLEKRGRKRETVSLGCGRTSACQPLVTRPSMIRTFWGQCSPSVYISTCPCLLKMESGSLNYNWESWEAALSLSCGQLLFLTPISSNFLKIVNLQITHLTPQ